MTATGAASTSLSHERSVEHWWREMSSSDEYSWRTKHSWRWNKRGDSRRRRHAWWIRPRQQYFIQWWRWRQHSKRRRQSRRLDWTRKKNHGRSRWTNADTQHHKLGWNTEETEEATSPADRHPRSRQMDQKSSQVESGTHHLDKRLNGEQEDQPRDGNTTWMTLWKEKTRRPLKVVIWRTTIHGLLLRWTSTNGKRKPEFPRGELKNYHTRKIFVFLHGLVIWKVMRRNVWSDIVSCQTRRHNNSTKYLLHASMTTTLKRKKWNLLETCHKYALIFFGKMLIIGTYWVTWYSVVSEQTCTIDYEMDQSLWQTPESFDILHPSHMWIQTKQCRLGLFQDSDFAGDLEDSKSTSGWTLWVFGTHTCVPISWKCKKQTSVSHISTESEIISLDAGLRLDGIPALDLWDLIVLVLGNTIQTHDRTVQPVVNCDKSHGPNKRSQGMFNVSNNVDCVPSNDQFSHQEGLLYVFEDNQAVSRWL